MVLHLDGAEQAPVRNESGLHRNTASEVALAAPTEVSAWIVFETPNNKLPIQLGHFPDHEGETPIRVHRCLGHPGQHREADAVIHVVCPAIGACEESIARELARDLDPAHPDNPRRITGFLRTPEQASSLHLNGDAPRERKDVSDPPRSLAPLEPA